MFCMCMELLVLSEYNYGLVIRENGHSFKLLVKDFKDE